MSDYERLLAKEENGDATNDSIADLLSNGNPIHQASSPLRTPACLIKIYIAIAATVMCILQIWILSQKHTEATVGGDPPSDLIEKSFSRDNRYMSLDHQYDHLWDWKNQSYVRITEPELDTEEEIPAIIAMFHQLHCVASLRVALQKGREGEPIVLDYHDNHHWPHCLNYLRNLILCYADSTLELPIIDNGTRTHVINGEMDTRQCRSADDVFGMGGVSWHEAMR